jgi:hypothetical protein
MCEPAANPVAPSLDINGLEMPNCAGFGCLDSKIRGVSDPDGLWTGWAAGRFRVIVVATIDRQRGRQMGRKAGYRGMHVIPWEHTELDHEEDAPADYLAVGASWRWWGEALRVDGPPGTLPLDVADGWGDVRARAARSVRRLLDIDAETETIEADSATPQQADAGFLLTDGLRSYAASTLAGGRLLLFDGAVPPRNAELWVVRLWGVLGAPRARGDCGVICFTPGTRIAAAGGARLVEALRPGDRILTRDDGPQEVIWTGHCRIGPVRLAMQPWLRPMRLRSGALGGGRPVGDLLVSPGHRLLLRGRAAEALFGTPEVLVAARDLLDDRRVTVDRTLRSVTYVHVMLARHQILWANGVESESFHPAQADLSGLDAAQRATMLRACPALREAAETYGEPARRCLGTPEAAILRHDAGWRH